jgi:O-acetyl-ADP-ribose deacetylase (regulator of RNase III)
MRKTAISIIQGNITDRPVDVIVNAANATLLGGGGVDGAIHKAAGPELLEECRRLGGCVPGQAKLTGAYGIKQAKSIVHTVGPIFGRDREREAGLLASCYVESLRIAVAQGYRSIAFPSISTGAYGYPIQEASRIALMAIRDYLEAHPGCLDLVEIATFSQSDYRMYLRAYQEIFAGIEEQS